MPTTATSSRHDRQLLGRWLRAGLLTSLVDGLFSSVLSAGFYGSSVQRLFQGVAAVPMGRQALEGGWMTAVLGILMHVCVAFSWSAVFLLLYERWPWLRTRVASRSGIAATAAIFGPLVWVTMSCVVIPLFTRRPPAITFRWWVQFVGHAPFVGLPIASSISRPLVGQAFRPAIARRQP